MYQYTTDNVDFTTGLASTCNTTTTVTITNSSGLNEEPNAGLDQDICIADGTTATLTSGNVDGASNPAIPGDVTLSTWDIISQPTGASINNSSFTSQANSAVTDVTGLTVPGLYIFELNFEKGNCDDRSDIVRVEVFEAPSAAIAGNNQGLACQQDTQLDATPASIGLGTWTFVSVTSGATVDTTPGIITIDSPNNPLSTVSNIP
ncbi:unnamed protein product, partial [Hapterophycus canaliculatus]